MAFSWTDNENFTNLNGTVIENGSVRSDTAFGQTDIDAYRSNLISVWTMETLGVDSVGSNILTATAVSQVVGKHEQAAAFNGSTSMLSIAHAAQTGLDFTTAMTVSAWVKPVSQVGTEPVIAKYRSNDNSRSYAMWVVDGKPYVFISADGTNNTAVYLQADSAISIGEWHHVVMRYDGAELVLFVDGAKLKTIGHTAGIANKTASVRIGADESGNFSADSIDEVCAWNVALSDAAISALYNSGAGKFYGLIDGATFTVHDEGVDYLDAGEGQAWDMSEWVAQSTGTAIYKYQYASYNAPQTPAYNGTWLTLSELQAVANSNSRYLYLKVQITDSDNDDTFDSLTGDTFVVDVTPPSAAAGYASCLHESSGTWTLFAAGVNGHDNTGGSGYAGMSLSVQVGGVEHFLANDFSWQTTDADALKKGNADTAEAFYDVGFTVGEPQQWRLTAWDNVGNYTRGDWNTFDSGGAVDIPDSPVITALVAGSGQLTVSVQLNDANNPAYVIYRTNDTDWSDPVDALKLVQDGDVVISGLTNATKYYVCAVSMAGGVYSLPGNVLAKAPASGDSIAIEVAIRELLISDLIVSGMTSSRIFPAMAPQNTATPFINFQRVSSNHHVHMVNASGFVSLNMQVDIYSTSYEEAKELADSVRLVLNGYRGDVFREEKSLFIESCVLSSEHDGFDDPNNGRGKGIYRVIQEYAISCKETVRG